MHSKDNWWQLPLRIYQANNFEVDPKEIAGERMARQCKDLHCNAIIVDAGGGISTFYHSDIEYLTPNPFLRPDQDFFKEMLDACRERGIRVFARNDYGNMSLETARKHPDWPLRLRNGEVHQVYDVVYTCPSSPLFLDIPILAFREQIERYDIDGVYINSLGGRCYCERCQRMFNEETGLKVPDTDDWDDPDFRAWIEWGYDLVDRIAQAQYKGVKAAKTDCAYFIDAAGMQEHGWIRGKGQDLIRHARYQDMASTESFNDLVKGYPQLLAPMVSRYVRNVGDYLAKPGTVFVSAFPGHSWPRSAQPLEEYRSYLASVYFNGCWAVTPWYGHCEREDRRITDPAREVFRFIEKYDELFAGARPEASVAVVYSRRTADYYGYEEPEERVMEPFYAACRALLEEHIPFAVISDEQLKSDAGYRIPDTGSDNSASEICDLKYDTFILPNVACLSHEAAKCLDQCVDQGGAVIADYETGLYDETGAARDDFALRCFGISLKERIDAPAEEWKHSRLHAYLEITEPGHPLFDGFENTGILPQKGPWIEVDHEGDVDVVCRHIRKSDAQPPEKGWRGEKGTTPMVLCRGKAVYFAIPLCSLLSRYRLPDHRRLLGNAVRMTTDLPIEVEAPCSIEVSLLRLSDGRRAIGLVNHTAGLLRDHTPVPTGPIRIRFKDETIKKAEALNGHEVSVKNGEVKLPILQTYDLITVDAT